MKITHLVCFLLTGALISSCSIEKRLYNKGFHIQKHHLPQRNDKTEVQSMVETSAENEQALQPQDSVQIEDPIVSNPGNVKTDCDTIYLLNGKKVVGNVVIKNNRWLVIDDCDSNLVANPTVFMKDIETIHYAYGEIEPINELTPEVKEKIEKQERKKKSEVKPLFYIGLSFLTAALILFLIAIAVSFNYQIMIYVAYLIVAALVLSIISLVYHTKRKKKLGIGLSAGQLAVAMLGAVATLLYFISSSF
ncbi:MAG: hypothetical protein IT221_02260 [Fluviicola sp.]|nr:hypothetical protein [Fluviicola sp.]